MSKVGCNTNETTNVAKLVSNANEDLADAMQTFVKNINSVNTSGGGLNVSNFSKNLGMVMRKVHNVISSVEKVGEKEKKVIKNFETRITNKDTL